MQKLLTFDPLTEDGEPRVQLVYCGDGSNNVKTASEAMDYISQVKPEKDYTYVLVLAMSAGEYYGCNRNGDAFAENPIPGVVEPGETLKDHYKTFETNAHVFEHHRNKDPNLSIGSVVKAFYNDLMHRVELLLRLDNAKAENIISALDEGKFPAVSMGCRIKYDVCSRRGCHNKAKTRADYCQHAMFHMNEIDPTTGEQNFVWNPSPLLFDISFVLKPADRIGYTIKKVANVRIPAKSSAYLAECNAGIIKSAEEFLKLSEIDKYIRGYTVTHIPRGTKELKSGILPRIVSHMGSLPDSACELLSLFDTNSLASSLHSLGIRPTAKEILSISAHKMGVPKFIRITIIKKSPLVAPASINLFRFYPELIPSFADSPWIPRQGAEDPLAIKVITPLMEKRSNLKEYLYRRAVRPMSGGALPELHPTEGLHSLIDINLNGSTLRTTRGALEKAQDNALERNALIGLGSAAGSLGLYKFLTANPLGKKLFPLALGGSALAGKYVYDNLKTPYFKGTDIPVNTEVTKMSSDNNFVDSCVGIANEYAIPGVPFEEAVKKANEEILNFSPNTDAGIFMKKLAAGVNPRGEGHLIDQLIKESGLQNFPVGDEVDENKISDIKLYLGESLIN